MALTRMSSEAEVEKVCPWLYQMKALLGERPNTKPVGIGNSTSKLDLDVLAPSAKDNGPEEISSDDNDEEEQADDQRRAPKKRSASVAELEQDVKPKPETPARPNVSKPTTTGTKMKKAKGYEELAKIAVAESVTHQKDLDLKIQKSKDKAIMVTAKVELKKAELEAKREKMRQAYEMERLKLQLELAKTRQVAPGIGVGVHPQLGHGGSIHSPGLYPPFSQNFGFDNGSQFDGMASGGGEGAGE